MADRGRGDGARAAAELARDTRTGGRAARPARLRPDPDRAQRSLRPGWQGQVRLQAGRSSAACCCYRTARTTSRMSRRAETQPANLGERRCQELQPAAGRRDAIERRKRRRSPLAKIRRTLRRTSLSANGPRTKLSACSTVTGGPMSELQISSGSALAPAPQQGRFGSRPVYRGPFIARPLYGLQQSKPARLSGLRGLAVVAKPGP